MHTDEIVKCSQAFELFTFSLCCICFGDAHMVIYKGKKVSFCSKSNGNDWAHKICVYKLIWFLCFLLKYAVVMFYRFGSFGSITYVLSIVIINVVMCQVSLQSWEIKVFKEFVLEYKRELFAFHLVYFWFCFVIDVFSDFQKICG